MDENSANFMSLLAGDGATREYSTFCAGRGHLLCLLSSQKASSRPGPYKQLAVDLGSRRGDYVKQGRLGTSAPGPLFALEVMFSAPRGSVAGRGGRLGAPRPSGTSCRELLPLLCLVFIFLVEILHHLLFISPPDERCLLTVGRRQGGGVNGG